MVIEDVHWIDPTSLELLDLTIDRAATMPVVSTLPNAAD